MDKQKSLILDVNSVFFPRFTYPRSENTPFFNASFRVNSVKIGLFVSRQMNLKALFSVTFWLETDIPEIPAPVKFIIDVKNWCCFNECVGGTAEIIDENDQHKLSRESAEHFMTAWDLSRPPFCKSVVPNVCPFSQFFGWLISWRAGFLSLQTIKLLITYRMNFAALDNNSNGNLYLLSVRWNHNLL